MSVDGPVFYSLSIFKTIDNCTKYNSLDFLIQTKIFVESLVFRKNIFFSFIFMCNYNL